MDDPVLMLGGIVLAAVLVPLSGGRLAKLAGIRLRARWLLAVALAVQLVTLSSLSAGPHGALAAAHMATYVLVAVWVWRNRELPGIAVVALGGACNAVAIAANGGTLPASAAALARAGIRPDPERFANSGVLAHPRLAVLGDIFAVPSGWPLANVFSVGDVLILTGAAYGMHRICGSVLGRRLRIPWAVRGRGPRAAAVRASRISPGRQSNASPEP